MKILVGYDGSVDADGAIHDLEYAGLPAKAAVLVLTITTPWEPISPDGQIPMGYAGHFIEYREEALEAAQELAKRAAGLISRRFPGWTVKSQAGLQHPALGLLEKAEAWKPDLIVLGSHGRTAMSRLLMGSVSQNVLHHAHCAVRITRPRIRTQEGPPRLLLGMDGSKSAKAAAARIAGRSWPRGTEVRVLGILGLRLNPGVLIGDTGAAYEAELDGARMKALERHVDAAVRILKAAGLKATSSIETGEPRSDLIEAAKSWRADCIFLGSRGMGAVERFLLGSVSSHVASHAPCSVEVVRAKGSGKAAGTRGEGRRGAGKRTRNKT